jgi:hypothetical protein
MANTPISVFISYSRTDSAFIDRLKRTFGSGESKRFVGMAAFPIGDLHSRLIIRRCACHRAGPVAG